MNDDHFIDYRHFLPLHGCDCGGNHVLRTYPVNDGFVVAVCCDTCRDRNGLPTRYSTETAALPTFDAAEIMRKSLLNHTPPEPKRERNVIRHTRSGKWTVQLKRHGKAINLGYFDDHAKAVEIRDSWLRNAA